MATISDSVQFGSNDKLLTISSQMSAGAVSGPNIDTAIGALVNVAVAGGRPIHIFNVDITAYGGSGDLIIVLYYKYIA